MAVYGQVTGRPKDDPPPPPGGLPDSTNDPEPSGDYTNKGGVGETKKDKPSASSSSHFREVEGSRDWNPPVPSRSHFTAATSPTRTREF